MAHFFLSAKNCTTATANTQTTPMILTHRAPGKRDLRLWNQV